jgi:hypothetical protein
MKVKIQNHPSPRFDSEQVHKCQWCQSFIYDEPKVIYGTGNSLLHLVVYHKHCDETRLRGAA